MDNRVFWSTVAVCAWTLSAAARAAHAGEPPPADTGRMALHGYATVNYHKYFWATDPNRRAAADLERLAIEPSYQVNDWIRFEAEIEFEHGGTGATMEFDKIEEFGEYELEVEKGGEVVIEELSLSLLLHPAFNVRLGHFFLPIGWAYALDEPADYFTVTRSETESALLPVLWHETGIAVHGELGPVEYQLQLVNGLDATGFSSGNWIARGHQGRFEMVNAQNLAWAGRLDYALFAGATAGVSWYYGNSADNRPKPDLKVPAHVGIFDLHGQWKRGPFVARGLWLQGRLENAGAVSKANKGVSNNLNVKRSPVASEVYGWFLEAGVDVLPLTLEGLGYGGAARGQKVELYGRYDGYNSMWKMDPGFVANPYWRREVWSGGVNWTLHPRVILKSQFSRRTLGSGTGDQSYTYKFPWPADGFSLPVRLSSKQEDTYSFGLGMMF